MIITRTPFRISFVGGGSDLREFYSKAQGAVISTTVNKFMYISSHNFFDEEKIRAKYSKTETVSDVEHLEHPILKNVLKQFKINGALEISSNADVPSGTGLGSSSSFTVGLLNNLYARAGKYVTKARLAQEACNMEINVLKEPIGKQDQYAAAFGGLNMIRFNPDETVEVEPIHLRKKTFFELQDNLVMFWTGVQRTTSSILTEQKKNLTTSTDKFNTLQEMTRIVDEIRDVLHSGNIASFGELLHKNWILKQKLASKISTGWINDLYNKAMETGATGGKILGAGGGGFLLLCCEKEKQDKLKKALSLKQMRFKFENEGTKIIYVGDEYD